MGEKKVSKRVKYKHYSQISVTESDLETANSMVKDSRLNLIAWMDSMREKGYEFVFELTDDLEASQLILRSVAPKNVDAGIWMFSGGFNYFEALLLCWYKFEIINGGKPLPESERKETKRYF